MKYSNMSDKVANVITKVFDRMLKVEANSTSCSMVYQPKAPKSLERFRKQ